MKKLSEILSDRELKLANSPETALVYILTVKDINMVEWEPYIKKDHNIYRIYQKLLKAKNYNKSVVRKTAEALYDDYNGDEGGVYQKDSMRIDMEDGYFSPMVDRYLGDDVHFVYDNDAILNKFMIPLYNKFSEEVFEELESYGMKFK